MGVKGPDKEDPRRFKVGFLGFGNRYERKHERHIINTVSVKNQTGRNTCCYESAIVQKEIDEVTELSVRSCVVWAKGQGYISGDGFSSLEAAQITLQKFGAADATLIDDTNRPWTFYSAPNVISDSVQRSAETHRTDSFWQVETMNELYELLDKGRVVTSAMYWYTGYNMGGGLRAPWIFTYRKGWQVGIHAVAVIGYDKNYHGEDVLIVQNSYGKNWGDESKFYVRVSDFEREFRIFKGYANLDMPKDLGKFIRDYTWKDVKSTNSPKVYRIEGGKKRHYVDIESYVAHKRSSRIHDVDNSLLTQLPDGEPITV